MSDQHETSKPIMATDVMKRIEALELGYRDAKATNAEIQEDVDRIDGAVAELLEWCKRLSREQTAEPATKAETQPIHPRHPGFGYDGKVARVIRCSGCGEMLTGLMDSRWRVAGDRWMHQCGDAQAGHHEARDFGPIVETQPPLQWVEWREGMTLEDG